MATEDILAQVRELGARVTEAAELVARANGVVSELVARAQVYGYTGEEPLVDWLTARLAELDRYRVAAADREGR